MQANVEHLSARGKGLGKASAGQKTHAFFLLYQDVGVALAEQRSWFTPTLMPELSTQQGYSLCYHTSQTQTCSALMLLQELMGPCSMPGLPSAWWDCRCSPQVQPQAGICARSAACQTLNPSWTIFVLSEAGHQKTLQKLDHDGMGT